MERVSSLIINKYDKFMWSIVLLLLLLMDVVYVTSFIGDYLLF